jgi:hypothetical protein
MQEILHEASHFRPSKGLGFNDSGRGQTFAQSNHDPVFFARLTRR